MFSGPSGRLDGLRTGLTVGSEVNGGMLGRLATLFPMPAGISMLSLLEFKRLLARDDVHHTQLAQCNFGAGFREAHCRGPFSSEAGGPSS